MSEKDEKDEDLSSPYNTEKEAREFHGLISLDAMHEGTGEAIKNQEEQGQKSFVGSDTLPREMGRYSDYDAKEVLEKSGVEFLGPVEDDPLFQYVELPEAWEKVSTDHPMWNHLVDAKGRPRAKIFYKAAFYDREAFLTLLKRFGYELDYDKLDEGIAQAKVEDCGEVIHKTKEVEFDPDEIEDEMAAKEEVELLATNWLDEEYPDWKNPAAYWD